jgi:molybdate transport system substrate-binding protein
MPTVAADPSRGTQALVARGEAELGVAAIATLFAPGIDLVGPIPAELQRYIQFAAGIGAGAKEPQAAADLIKFLTASAAAATFKAKGMEAAGPRS